MTRIEYDLFRAEHPELRLRDWCFLSAMAKTGVGSACCSEHFHGWLIEHTLIGDLEEYREELKTNE